MIKIKVIDLLNKIANGEKVPKEIEFRKRKYIYDYYLTDYKQDIGTYLFTKLFSEDRTETFINNEVEIIEEDKEIKKIGHINYCESEADAILHKKIDEIIDKINKMEDK